MNLHFITDLLRKIFVLFITVSAFLFIFNSCQEDPGFLGKDLLPDGDNITTSVDTITDINAWTASGRSLFTRINTQLLLGNMVDPVFGHSKADIMMPLIPKTHKLLGNGVRLDSVRFDLVFDRYYGDTVDHIIRIYELNESMIDSLPYYSDFDATGLYSTTELASKHIIGYKDTISISINNAEFNQKILNATAPGDSTFFYDSLFTDVFKGLYITTDLVTATPGSLLYVDSLFNDSRILFFYENDTTISLNDTLSLVYSAGFSLGKARANLFSHDPSLYRAGVNLDNETNTDTLMFLLGMGGLDVHLRFPELEHWKDSSGRIAINKAELILPVETSIGPGKTNFPERLSLYSITESDNYEFLYDYHIDATQDRSMFNGKFESIGKDKYVFNISRHFQAYVNDSVQSLDLVLRPGINSQSARRTILKGPDAAVEHMKLVIVYTRLQ